MSISRIIGRISEKQILTQVKQSSEAEFVAVYGRLRVGKTFLIREFFEKNICFEIVGIYQAPLKEQLENFTYSLGKAQKLEEKPKRPNSWMEAFYKLEKFLEETIKKQPHKKQVVFIDELPWLNGKRSNFLSNLDHFWNRWGVKQNNLVLVVCGSAASWMLQNIVNAKGSLHNRLTKRIRLLPFTLLETEEFFKSKNIFLTRFQTAELYMAIGGIPYYLSLVAPGMSAAQNIDNLCFSTEGALRDEYEKLLPSLFLNSKHHEAIIRLLVQKKSGMTRNELITKLKLSSGGTISKQLNELEESGFIQAQIPFGKNSNNSLYKLTDEYCLFYLRWIEKLGKRNIDKGYWMSLQNSPNRAAWAGFSFENLCIKHIYQLKTALGISGVTTTHSPWRYIPKSNDDQQGAQIDLLIDRKDETINICEMKFSQGPFTITKQYSQALRQKREVFRDITGTRKNLFITIVTSFGLSDNAYSRELISGTITLEDLFK